MNCEQQAVRLGRGELHGIYYEPPPDTEVSGAAIICDPFAEEKKCAQRTLAETARVLAGTGIAALHFDYRGTGDSSGDFVDFGPRQWQEDVQAAIEFVHTQLEVSPVGLLGLRLGATLAAQVAEQNATIAWLVLWEPIIDGQQFVRNSLRRSLIKAMLTQGGEFSAPQVTNRHQAELIDLDGYQISAPTQAELAQIDLSGPKTFSQPVLVVNIAAQAQVTNETQTLTDSYNRGQAQAVVLEPFWNRIGIIDGEPLLRMTQQWLQQIV